MEKAMSSEVSIMLCAAPAVVAGWLWQRHVAAQACARLDKLREDGSNPLSALVAPLKQEIDNLEASISNSDEKSASSHTDLMGKITMLVDQTNKVTEQANNLAMAIRGDAQLTGIGRASRTRTSIASAAPIMKLNPHISELTVLATPSEIAEIRLVIPQEARKVNRYTTITSAI